MKLSNIKCFLLLCCFTVSFCGCDNHEDDKAEFIGKWRWSFDSYLTWDEITYEEANPKNHVLTQYKLIPDTLSDGEIQLYLHQDGKRIGSIDMTLSGLVYFSNESVSNYLLYDFGRMDRKFDGYYCCYYSSVPSFKKKNEMDWDNDLYISYPSFRSHWVRDSNGGYIISGLGSTNGILSPLESAVPVGFRHIVLQIFFPLSRMLS